MGFLDCNFVTNWEHLDRFIVTKLQSKSSYVQNEIPPYPPMFFSVCRATIWYSYRFRGTFCQNGRSAKGWNDPWEMFTFWWGSHKFWGGEDEMVEEKYSVIFSCIAGGSASDWHPHEVRGAAAADPERGLDLLLHLALLLHHRPECHPHLHLCRAGVDHRGLPEPCFQPGGWRWGGGADVASWRRGGGGCWTEIRVPADPTEPILEDAHCWAATEVQRLQYLLMGFQTL